MFVIHIVLLSKTPTTTPIIYNIYDGADITGPVKMGWGQHVVEKVSIGAVPRLVVFFLQRPVMPVVFVALGPGNKGYLKQQLAKHHCGPLHDARCWPRPLSRVSKMVF